MAYKLHARSVCDTTVALQLQLPLVALYKLPFASFTHCFNHLVGLIISVSLQFSQATKVSEAYLQLMILTFITAYY